MRSSKQAHVLVFSEAPPTEYLGTLAYVLSPLSTGEHLRIFNLR
jgi:hypothetical protein